jgi:hypothetical protein
MNGGALLNKKEPDTNTNSEEHKSEDGCEELVNPVVSPSMAPHNSSFLPPIGRRKHEILIIDLE